MNNINSIKNYKYSFLEKKNKKFKNLKNGEQKVHWVPHLYILLHLTWFEMKVIYLRHCLEIESKIFKR